MEKWHLYSRGVAGGGAIVTATGAGGYASETTSYDTPPVRTTQGAEYWFYDPGYTSGFDITNNPGDHNHGIPQGTQLMVAGGGTVTWTPSGSHVHLNVNYNHDHKIDLPPHNHSFEVPNHTHEINLPNHTHELEFGIFEGPKATAVVIKVDGNEVPITSPSVQNVDLVPYLAKDADGKILRGTWHEIEISPNSLSRIVASVVVQLFVQSRGGGNY